MASEKEWRDAIVSRFSPRETLQASEMFDRVWAQAGAARDEVEMLLALLTDEYDVAPGFFRPDDRLDWLLEPVPAAGFWARATNSVRAGDRDLALGDHVEARCRQHGLSLPRDLQTLADVARACSPRAAT